MRYLILPLASLAITASAAPLAGAPPLAHPPAHASVGPTGDVHNPYIECTVRRQGRHLRINQCCCTNPDGHPACRSTWGAAYALCSGGQTPSSVPSVKTATVNTTVTVSMTSGVPVTLTAVPRAIDEETNTAKPHVLSAQNQYAYDGTAWMIGERDRDGKLVARALRPEEVMEVMAASEKVAQVTAPSEKVAEAIAAAGNVAGMAADEKVAEVMAAVENVAVIAHEEPEKRQWHQWGGLVEVRPGHAALPVTSVPEPSSSKAPLLQHHWHFGPPIPGTTTSSKPFKSDAPASTLSKRGLDEAMEREPHDHTSHGRLVTRGPDGFPISLTSWHNEQGPPWSLPHGRLPKTTSTDSSSTPKAMTTEQVAVRTPEGPTPDRSHWHDYRTQQSIVTVDASGHVVTPSSTASSLTNSTSDEPKSKSKSTHTTRHTPPWALPHGRLPPTTSTSTTSTPTLGMVIAGKRAADAPPRHHDGCHIEHGLWRCPPSASEQPLRNPWHDEHSWLVTEPARTHDYWHGAHSGLATTSTPTPETVVVGTRGAEALARDHAGCHVQHGPWECPSSASDEPARPPTPWHDEHGRPVLTHHASEPLTPLSAPAASPTLSTVTTRTALHRLHSERTRAARAVEDAERDASSSVRVLPSAHPSLADSGTAPAAPTSLVRPDALGYLYSPETGHHIDLPHPAFPEYEDPNHTHPVHVTHHADGSVTTSPLPLHPGGAAGHAGPAAHHGPNATTLLRYKNHPDPDAKHAWDPWRPHGPGATFWHIHCEGSGYDPLLPDINHLLGCFYSQSEADRTGRFICGQEEIYLDLDRWANVDDCVLGCQRCMEKYGAEKRERMLCTYHQDMARCAAGWWSSKGNDTMVDEGNNWTLRHNSWAATAGDDYGDPQVVPNWGHSEGDEKGQSTQNRVNKLHDGPDREVTLTDPRVMPMPTVQTVGPTH